MNEQNNNLNPINNGQSNGITPSANPGPPILENIKPIEQQAITTPENNPINTQNTVVNQVPTQNIQTNLNQSQQQVMALGQPIQQVQPGQQVIQPSVQQMSPQQEVTPQVVQPTQQMVNNVQPTMETQNIVQPAQTQTVQPQVQMAQPVGQNPQVAQPQMVQTGQPVAAPNAQGVVAQPQAVANQNVAPVPPTNGTFGPSVPIGSDNNLTNVGFVASAAPLPKKKNNKIKYAIIAIILIAIAASGYFFVYPYVKKTYLDKPINVYKETIENSFKQINSTINDVVHEKAIYDLQVSLDSNLEVLTPYSGYKYGLNLGVDPSKKNIQIGYSVTDSSNVEYSAYSYIKDNNKYLRYSTYRDSEGRTGLIHTGAANLEEASQIFATFEQLISGTENINNDDLTYLSNKLSELIIKSIDETKLSKEDASITFNSETIKVSNNKYTLDYDNRIRTLKEISNGLTSDDKILEILANLFERDKDSVKELLTYKENDDVSEEDKKYIIYINIYTYGLTNDIIGYAITDSTSEKEFHYYFDEYENFEVYLSTTNEDEESGKKVETKIEATGKKEDGKRKVTIKYNGKDFIILDISKWDEKNIDLKYTIKTDEGDMTGNFKYSNDLTNERLKISLEFSVEVKNEYINVSLNFEEDWTSEVANINTNTATILSEEELKSIQQTFESNLMRTPIGTIYQTISGMYNPEINDYYNSSNNENNTSTENPTPENSNTENTNPENNL